MENHQLRQGTAALATAVALPRCADRLFLKEYTKVQKEKGNLHVLTGRDGGKKQIGVLACTEREGWGGGGGSRFPTKQKQKQKKKQQQDY